MASSSSQIKRYKVFTSFHGPDVRRGFLGHLQNHFASKGITTFKDQEIERGHSIGPALRQAIRESRISIVLLSEKYASSSWCLDELVEIFKCKEDQGQIVMTVFYGVTPSDVRKQRGDFGRAFVKTCIEAGKTDEDKQRWIKALTDVANIEGEDYSLKWANEAEMIQKIATDVSKKLNVTPSRDFDDKVGLQTHLRKVKSLLCLERIDQVKMIGIWGPPGIGKSTIARALHNQLSSDFGLRCFMGNLGGVVTYRSVTGVDEYDSKLKLQNQLLSEILNQRDMRVDHLGMVKEWLHDQKVLIILDDVDNLDKLDALARELSWFGLGSRIIVTTQDKKILKAHGIKDIYHVDFPSGKEALEMLSLSAFKQSCVPDGFEEVARKVAELCGYLPLALSVVGSSLRGESKNEWEVQLSRIESSLDRNIEDVLRVGYDRLSKNDQALFLHIACLFPNDVRMLLADSNLVVENGLQTLLAKSLVHITSDNDLAMHSLLVQMGRQIVREESKEPGKRQFLVDPQEIGDVLANETGTGSVIGISVDIYKSKVGDFSISGRAFKGMRNLRFLRLYGYSMISGDMEYLPRLRLLVWHNFPRKRLPPKFQPECLIELCMFHSKLEKLWDGNGIQPLPNLKKIYLSYSEELKEIPNLSKATNLEILRLDVCTSLVELPSSIRNLHKLKELSMWTCVKLRVIPTNINLASLERVDMSYCSSLTTFPDFSSNIKIIKATKTKIEDVPASVAGGWSRLDTLEIGSRSLTKLTKLDLSDSDIKKIPDCVIGLPGLEILILRNCRKLVSLQSLPPSLLHLYANDCGSLKSVSFSFDEPRAYITFNDCRCVKSETDAKRVSSITFYHPKRRVFLSNCLSLDEEATRVIIQRWAYMCVCLPGKQVPAEFTHKAKGNSITISPGTFSASSRFKACLLLTPTGQFSSRTWVVCRLRSKGVLINELEYYSWWSLEEDATISEILSDHLFVFSGSLFKEHRCLEADATTSEILFEFSCGVNDANIIECGVQILTEEDESSSSKWKEQSEEAAEVSKDESKHRGRWSWIKELRLKKKKL